MATYPYPLAVVNPRAENGSTGWTAQTGSILAREGSPPSGATMFATNSGTNLIVQTINLPEETWADVDAGLYEARLTAWMSTYATDSDWGYMFLRAVDGVDAVIREERAFSGDFLNWTRVGTSIPLVSGTRKLTIGWWSTRNSGLECSVYFADFTLDLIEPVNRAVGRGHRYWGLRISSANLATSTTGFRRLEFLDDIGIAQPHTHMGIGFGSLAAAEATNTSEGTSIVSSSVTNGFAWATVDLGDVAYIKGIRITNTPTANHGPSQFEVIWSDDGACFYPESRFERSHGWTANQVRSFFFNTDRWRFHYRSSNSLTAETHCVISDMEIRGVEGGPDLTLDTTGLERSYAFGDAGDQSTIRDPRTGFNNVVSNTDYIGGGTPYADKWIEWHFPTPTEVAELAVTARPNGLHIGPRLITVLRSTDQGFTYTPITLIVADPANYVASVPKIFRLSAGRPTTGLAEVTKSSVWVVSGHDKYAYVSKSSAVAVIGPPTDGVHITKSTAWMVSGPPDVISPRVDVGGHRYWRIFLRRSRSGNGSGGTFELCGTDGEAISGFGGTPTVSSGNASDAFTNRTSSSWANEIPYGVDQWAAYDFGEGWSPRIDMVRAWPQTVNIARSPYTFEVQYSDDGTVWNTDWLVNIEEDFVTNTPIDCHRPLLANPRESRYWLVHFGGLNSATLSIAEMALRNVEGGINLMAGRTSGMFSQVIAVADLVPIFDGLSSTRWTTTHATGSAAIRFDLSFPVEIREIEMMSRNNYPLETAASGNVYRSDDGKNYKLAWQWTGWTDWPSAQSSKIATTSIPLEDVERGRRRNSVVVVS